MFAVISGGTTSAEFLVNIMMERGYQVAVIESNHETVEHLSEVLPPQVLIIEGDGCDSATQNDAETSDADLFLALTGHDDTNLVACEIAMTAFGVPRCIAMVNDPKNTNIFRKIGIQPVSITELIARLVEEESVSADMRTVFNLREGGLNIVEMTIPNKLRHKNGVPVSTLANIEDAQLIAVLRDGDAVILNDGVVLEPGETLIAAVTGDAEENLRAFLKQL